MNTRSFKDSSTRRWRRAAAGVAAGALALAACGGSGSAATPRRTDVSRADGAPVPLNPNTPVEYPAALQAQGIEGTVVLRLYVDEQGTPQPDSTRVAESSGYPSLDSAALASAKALRFAPALSDGRPVAAAFLQPVQFRLPRGTGRSP